MKENRNEMLTLLKGGETYQSIGNRFGVSRQRAFQIIHNHSTRKNKINKEKLAKLGLKVNQCRICKVSAEFANLELHHKDKNTSNNHRTNLMIICRRCHIMVDAQRPRITY